MRRIPDPAKASRKVLRERVRRVVARFESEKGMLEWSETRDPVAGLVNTLLSHNTTDVNRDKAFDALREKYPGWEEVHHAPPEELAGVIRVAGLNRQKARRIKGLLGYLKEKTGDYNADFLLDMDFDEAVAELAGLEGVGLKTLAVVMCFNLGVDVFPVDTHVHRLCRRFGFVPDNFNAVKTFQTMRSLVPEGKSFQFHLHLIRHGRETCRARGPLCEHCFIADECLFHAKGKG